MIGTGAGGLKGGAGAHSRLTANVVDLTGGKNAKKSSKTSSVEGLPDEDPDHIDFSKSRLARLLRDVLPEHV